jgi:hypothetical protein
MMRCPESHARISNGVKLKLKWSVLVLIATALWAAEAPQTAYVKAVKEYSRGRIAYWEGNVPIYDGYPFYDITLAVNDKTYVVRYESFTGYYPSAWKVGNAVPFTLKDHGPFLLNGDQKVSVRIVNPYDCVEPIAPPRIVGPPQVPCQP